MAIDSQPAFLLAYNFLSVMAQQKCCRDLECFALGAPWATILRPIPPPQCPDECPARFYMYNRPNISTMYNVTGWPIALPNNTAFDGSKTTVLFIPGWYHYSKDRSYEQLKDAYLRRVDVNYIFLDWEKCAQNRYLQLISSARVIAAQAIRFLKYLYRYHKACLSKMHFVGIGIGAHIASYIAKGLGGVRRITGLQPTLLLFDGFGKEVRLDVSDADFVEVGYTETLSTISKGHVEYYFNGFLSQPGCKEQVGEKALQALREGHFSVLKTYRAFIECNHIRALLYYINSLTNTNCTLWGEKTNLTTVLFNQFTGGTYSENTTKLQDCTISTCIPWGLQANEYPARGSFFVATSDKEPFCIPRPDVDKKMSKLLKEYKNLFYKHYNDNEFI